VKFDQKFLTSYELDGYMRVPLTFEDERIMVPKNLEDGVMRVLEKTIKYEKPRDAEAVRDFIELVDVYE
jgi:hypothetical protein